MTNLVFIWDYDGPIGRINCSLPYNFHYKQIIDEIENVNKIVSLANDYKFKMVFAVTGFSCERTNTIFDLRDQIKMLHDNGHEIASHSWKHEWFPHLNRKQAKKSIERSVNVISKCIGKTISGFILPFNRPMTWYSKGAISLGDNAFWPFHYNADLGNVITLLSLQGVKWLRVHYYPFIIRHFRKGNQIIKKQPFFKKNVLCLPSHNVGFSNQSIQLLDVAVNTNRDIFISSHPLNLSLKGGGHLDLFKRFLEKVNYFVEEEILRVTTVEQIIEKNYH